MDDINFRYMEEKCDKFKESNEEISHINCYLNSLNDGFRATIICANSRINDYITEEDNKWLMEKLKDMLTARKEKIQEFIENL